MEPLPNQDHDAISRSESEQDQVDMNRLFLIEAIKSRIQEGYWATHEHVLYPHQVAALSDAQRIALAQTFNQWLHTETYRDNLMPLSVGQIISAIDNKEVFVYMVDGIPLACARLRPDSSKQFGDGRGRVWFEMDMKIPKDVAGAPHPDTNGAFGKLAEARLVFCANKYPPDTWKPRTVIKRCNVPYFNRHAKEWGLDTVETNQPDIVCFKLDPLIKPLTDCKLSPKIIEAYETNEPASA